MLAGISPHVDAALVAGTTGESTSLDDHKRVEVFSTGVDMLGAGRALAHVGHGSARQVFSLAERARRSASAS